MSGRINNPSPIVAPYMGTIPGLFFGCNFRVAGTYYGPLGAGTYGNGSIAMVAGKIYAVPFLVTKQETFDRIAITVLTGSAGSARLGIYADSGSCAPGALLVQGEIDTTAIGDKEITISQALTPGLYWLAALFQATPNVRCPLIFSDLIGYGGDIASAGNTSCYYTTQTYGALPNPHPTATTSQKYLVGVSLRRA
jgi:hypothetical protein